MMESGKPRKQRFFRYNAPLHIAQHFVNLHIDKQLAKRLGIKKRSIQVSKGDTVKVMSGGSKGKAGKVMRVDIKRGFLFIDSLKKKNARGKEYYVPVYCSNAYITEFNLGDKRRAAKLKVAPVKITKIEDKSIAVEGEPEAGMAAEIKV
jgi:large subunit ribosomal protein L24